MSFMWTSLSTAIISPYHNNWMVLLQPRSSVFTMRYELNLQILLRFISICKKSICSFTYCCHEGFRVSSENHLIWYAPAMYRSIRNVLMMSLFPLFKKSLMKLAAPIDDAQRGTRRSMAIKQDGWICVLYWLLNETRYKLYKNMPSSEYNYVRFWSVCWKFGYYATKWLFLNK